MRGRKNEMLAWALAVLEWSPERLARALNRELSALGHTRTVSRNSPAQWRDHGMVPRPPIPGIAAHLLSQALDRPMSVSELWQGRAHDPLLVVPADFGLDVPWTPSGTVELLNVVRSDRMLRREFLTIGGMAVLGPAADWARFGPEPLATSTMGRHVPPGLVDAVGQNLNALRRLDDQGGGEFALPRAESELAFLIDLLKTARYDGRMAARLHQTVADVAQFAAWVCQDLGHTARAQRHYLTGLHAAHTGDDRQLGAYILGRMANLAMERRRPAEALLMLDAASRGANGKATPTVQATLAFKAAHAHALAGDELACATALNQAEKLLDHARAEDDPSWTYWLTDNPENCMSITIGACLADLGGGQLRRAERHLRAGIDRYTPEYFRDKAVDLPILAQVQRRRRELDAACATAREALRLSLDTGTHRGLTAVRDFRDRLRADAGAPVVDDFLAETRDQLAVA